MLKTSDRILFSDRIIRRAYGLIDVANFPHNYRNIINAISVVNCCWEALEQVTAFDDPAQINIQKRYIQSQNMYLKFAGIYNDETATNYMDWLEPRLREWGDIYQQLQETHRMELDRLARSFRV